LGLKNSLNRFVDGQDTWFCLPLKSAAQDKLVMYVTRRLSEKSNGFFAAWEVTSRDPEKDSECTRYGSHGINLYRVNVRQFSKFKQNITLKELKKEPLFKTSSFVTKNAQGTVFQLSEEQYEWILNTGISGS
jgi:hypothetical protein